MEELLSGSSLLAKTAEKAENIGVHDGRGFSQDEAANGGGRVGAHAGKRPPPLGTLGKTLVGQNLGAFMEVSGPVVVSEALPHPQDLFFRRRREALNVGEAFHPATEALLYGGRNGLLEHDLGDPNPVRRSALSPRVGVANLSEPV